jgi:hypothetical protein
LAQGVYSYKHVKALAERLFASAMASMDEGSNHGSDGVAGDSREDGLLAQQHDLIRQADEYADLFTHAATLAGAAVSRAMDAAQGGQS